MSSPAQVPPPRVGAKSHPGKVRSENQDRMSRFATPLGEVFLVADGMGGHEGGAVAARLVSEGFEQQLGRLALDLSPQAALQHAARHLNADIFRQAHAGDPRTEKMGSTVVLALISGSRVLIGHAGDSRAYLFRQGRLQRLTKDHSAVQKMLDHHMLTEAEAREHPDASVINRAFGQAPELDLELSPPLPLQTGDGLLLCTDGLCGYVDDDAIERVIGSTDDAQQVTERLLELALETGGEDNITIQYLQFGTRPAWPPPTPPSSEERARPRLTGLPLEQQLPGPASLRPAAATSAAETLHLSWPWLLAVVISAAALGVGLMRGLQYLMKPAAPETTASPASAPVRGLVPTTTPERPSALPHTDAPSSLPPASSGTTLDQMTRQPGLHSASAPTPAPAAQQPAAANAQATPTPVATASPSPSAPPVKTEGNKTKQQTPQPQAEGANGKANKGASKGANGGAKVAGGVVEINLSAGAAPSRQPAQAPVTTPKSRAAPAPDREKSETQPKKKKT